MTEYWTDHNGKEWKVPTIIGRLKFRIPCHAALRAFVFERDGYACVQCGAKASNIPAVVPGREALMVPDRWCLVMDHTLSRRNGGAHHPSNLRTFCDTCNAAKVGLVDKGGR